MKGKKNYFFCRAFAPKPAPNFGMGIFDPFLTVADFRVQGRCLHQLVNVLALLLCGTLSGCDDLPEICDYGRARLVFFRTELGLELRSGISSEDTLERI